MTSRSTSTHDEFRAFADHLRSWRYTRTSPAFSRPNGLPIILASTVNAILHRKTTVTDIAEETGATPRTIRGHLTFLADQGLVTFDRDLDKVHPCWDDNFGRHPESIEFDPEEF